MATTSGNVTRFKDCHVVIDGLGRIDAYDDGSSIVIDWTDDRNTHRGGNDGLGVFAEKAGTHASLALTLLENSDGNQLLHRWIESGLTRGCTFTDANNGTVLASSKCRVQKIGTITKSSGAETRPWTILADNLGGNQGKYE